MFFDFCIFYRNLWFYAQEGGEEKSRSNKKKLQIAKKVFSLMDRSIQLRIHALKTMQNDLRELSWWYIDIGSLELATRGAPKQLLGSKSACIFSSLRYGRTKSKTANLVFAVTSAFICFYHLLWKKNTCVRAYITSRFRLLSLLENEPRIASLIPERTLGWR